MNMLQTTDDLFTVAKSYYLREINDGLESFQWMPDPAEPLLLWCNQPMFMTLLHPTQILGFRLGAKISFINGMMRPLTVASNGQLPEVESLPEHPELTTRQPTAIIRENGHFHEVTLESLPLDALQAITHWLVDEDNPAAFLRYPLAERQAIQAIERINGYMGKAGQA